MMNAYATSEQEFNTSNIPNITIFCVAIRKIKIIFFRDSEKKATAKMEWQFQAG